MACLRVQHAELDKVPHVNDSRFFSFFYFSIHLSPGHFYKQAMAASDALASLMGLAGASYGTDEVAGGDGDSRRPCPGGWQQAPAAGGVRAPAGEVPRGAAVVHARSCCGGRVDDWIQ